VNLELPFDETDPAALDARIAEIDRELDALFIQAVEREQEKLRREREAKPDDAAA
jgi:hypothetical protein